MKHLIALSEALEELELSGGGTAEVQVSADGDYDESRGVLALTLDSSIRPLLDAEACVRPAWLPNPQSLQEHVDMDEATTLARDIFQHWVEKVRRAIPSHALLERATAMSS
jgi:hypothetical protein